MANEVFSARESRVNPTNAVDRRTKSVANIYEQAERIIGSRHGQRAINIARTYIRNIDNYNSLRFGVNTGSTPSLKTAKYPSSVYRGKQQ